jgi:uncharacterized protein YgiB involved in biofilm formation
MHSDNPVEDADRYNDAQFKRSEAQHALEAELMDKFLNQCALGDANALLDWAPTVADYDAMRKAKAPFTAAQCFQRRQTMAEVMYGACEYSSGPSFEMVMQLVINASLGLAVQDQAQALIKEMAAKWVWANAPEAEEVDE